ncbi:MAG: hypothetical protein JWN78_1327 [Bacteroidota bacterium]|nr:hypothetical protein [Bacteroidota bacterium]
MDIYDNDILSFFKSLNQFKVEYILIGGFATNLHGYSRTTGDIDIWLHDTNENRLKFIDALKVLNMEGMEAFTDLPLAAGFCEIILDNGFYVDIIGMPKGLEKIGFEKCYDAAEHIVVSSIIIPYLHFNHLIESKKATGRLKDLLDIEELGKIRKQKE